VLQFGRLALHGKAHPQPLFLALARAAARLGRPLHLILAGSFPMPLQEEDCRALAAALGERVITHIVDGNRPDVGGVRSAADIATLLSDNIQESFGLAPVELMAAGLPVVASDWDGLRDTVEHGVTGFRVDTLMPPPGAGEVLARRYASVDTYDAFLAGQSQSTAIDIAQAADAFHALAADPLLRRRMGDAARERARLRYDWRVVIAAYLDLLEELARRRARPDTMRVPRRPGSQADPTRPDPFAAFAGHASRRIEPSTRLAPAPAAPARVADVIGGERMTLLHTPVLPPARVLDAMIARVADAPCSVTELRRALPQIDATQFMLGIGWLIKFGFLSTGD
jgi:alpha-maltose-1-phosphate synthase